MSVYATLVPQTMCREIEKRGTRPRCEACKPKYKKAQKLIKSGCEICKDDCGERCKLCTSLIETYNKRCENCANRGKEYSAIGQGVVIASVTRDSAKKIAESYNECLASIVPFTEHDSPVTKRPRPTSPPLTHHELYKQIVKKIERASHAEKTKKRLKTGVDPKTVETAIKDFYETLRGYSDTGTVGLLPIIYKKEGSLPATVEQFIATAECELLQTFHRYEQKKK